MGNYFGTDGIRGRVGDWPMTPDFVMHLGWAAGGVLAAHGRREVLIGKDTRLSGYMFESALEAGLAAAGVSTRLVGPMPTPAIAYLARTFRQAAGAVISASHNPYYDNGVKFFSGLGTKLPDAVEAEIEARLDRPMQVVAPAELGRAARVDDADGRYIEFCKGTIPFGTDLRGLKLVVDSAHGATYSIAPRVFRELGAQVIAIGSEPDGLNINDGCGATAPEAMAARVLAEGADAGLALDGDGDRVIMVDRYGRVVDGDALLLIMARARHERGDMIGGVVGTLMSNLGLERALAELGIPFSRAAVGDRFVLEQLQANGWKLGGEASGHIVCLDRTTTGDGIVSALQVLARMVDTGASLDELAACMDQYPQVLLNVPVAERVDPGADGGVRAAVKSVEAELGEAGRVLLRPSGTEPLVRVMVEGPDAARLESLAGRIADAVRIAFGTDEKRAAN
ncbi:MAG: phosphoglucosamine mutase [Halofilum sp. (in: g-proteobacteria)]